MAQLTGIIEYEGSFKSIRHWKVRNERRIYAGEKGGAHRELIRNHRAFARTRENNEEFKGCGMAVRAIRLGLNQLLPERADGRFTSRLVALVKRINQEDRSGVSGRHAILFSENRGILRTLTFHQKRKSDFELKRCIKASHPESRTEATVTVTGLNPDPSLVPGTPQYYRVIHHLSIIPDFGYSESEGQYGPLGRGEVAEVSACSDFIPINTSLSVELKAAFPEGTVVGDGESVLQCVGLWFYRKVGEEKFVAERGGSTMVVEVF